MATLAIRNLDEGPGIAAISTGATIYWERNGQLHPRPFFDLSSLRRAQIHHSALAITHVFPLRRHCPSCCIVSFAIGYGLGMMLNVMLLATTTQLLASNLSKSSSMMALR